VNLTSRLGRLLGLPQQPSPRSESDELAGEGTVPGDRGVSATYRPQSLQTRMTQYLAFGVGVVVMTVFLLWYYQHALAHDPRDKKPPPSQGRAGSASMALPPLGRIDAPLIERVLGPAPVLPEEAFAPDPETLWPNERYAGRSQDPALLASDHSQTPDRRLSGEAFVPASARTTFASGASERTTAGAVPFGRSSAPSPAAGEQGELARLLEPTAVAVAHAQVLPTQRLLLPKGAILDCTLGKAVSSQLPGMTTCVTATDTFSADGSVVLIERGSTLFGETRGNVRAGSNRVFVLWTEARTPYGVVVPLASPGTDELGRSGLPGEVDRHFWDRFGAAILISVIDGGVQAAVQRESRGDSVVVNPAGSTSVMTEVLKETIQIPPTVTARHGDRIAVLVARDLDFRSVYELRTASDR